VLPKKSYKKEKHRGPPKGKEKIELAKFIGEEAMSFQDSPLHGSENDIAGEKQEKEDLCSPQSLQEHHEGEVTPKKKWSLQEFEEIITELTISEQGLRKENETLKENNLCIRKEHEEWV